MKRAYGFDWLRALAAFGIVGCHLNLATTTPAATKIIHLTDLNVGVFALISGFLLALSLEKAQSGLQGAVQTIGRRLRRILPIYFVWSLVYVICSCGFACLKDADCVAKLKAPSYWLSIVFLGGASCHLWYLSSLLYVSSSLCIVSYVFPKGPVRKVFWGVLSVGGICAAIWIPGNFFFYTIRLLAFMAAGMLLCEMRNLVMRVPRGVWMGLVGLSLVAAYTLPIWPHHFLSGYLCALCLVPVFLSGEWSASPVGGWFAKTSLAVYLIHPLLSQVFGLIIKRMWSAPYGLVPMAVAWLLSYVAALALAACVVKVPQMRRLVM